MPVQLYLDCDGVLADFETAANELLGMDRADYQARFGREMYLRCLAAAPNFYGELALKPGANELFAAVRHLSPVILTAVPEGGWAESQKQAWVARHFPGTQVITTQADSKSRYCKPGDVLIDDNSRHCVAWSAAGGAFIHYEDASTTLKQLRAIRPAWFSQV
jgi:hypothetical protein